MEESVTRAHAFTWFWTNPAVLRRIVVSIPVLICLSLVLPGCASPGVMCGMKDRYEREIPMFPSGSVRLDWDDDISKCPSTSLACTSCEFNNCKVHIRKRVGFSDVCAEAIFGHEMQHAMGAWHERD